MLCTVTLAVAWDTYYYLEFTSLTGADEASSPCNSGTFRSAGQGFPLDTCVDLDPCSYDDADSYGGGDSCDDDSRSSYSVIYNEAGKKLVWQDYKDLGCQEQNFKSATDRLLDVCRFLGLPDDKSFCDSTHVMNGCSIRYNQTSNGNDNCDGAKPNEMACWDSGMYSLSPVPPQ
jgi:hypothetical protein